MQNKQTNTKTSECHTVIRSILNLELTLHINIILDIVIQN